MNIELIKEDSKGKVYRVDDFKIYYRNKGSISGDNSNNPKEVIYLISGSAGVAIKSSQKTLKAPMKIEIPAKTYHKIKALSDVIFILFET